MHCLKALCNNIITKAVVGSKVTAVVPSCGIKYFPPPPNYDHIILPEKPKLKIMEKVPTYPAGTKLPKMQKRLKYMRGPELIHNSFLHKQYGIIAKGGGRMRHEHFEMIRLSITRGIDVKRMFAIWRVDPPWQPVTKKGQGQRMGGGKGAIDHYVTPIKADRVIMELGGKCEYEEVKKLLKGIACRLPFAAIATSYEKMEAAAAKAEEMRALNTNPYTMKYIIENNMGGCHRWLSPMDFHWHGRYR